MEKKLGTRIQKRRLKNGITVILIISSVGCVPSEQLTPLESEPYTGEESIYRTTEERASFSWERAQHIEAAICKPWFPDYTVNICDFGAIANDNILDTEAIRNAIDEVSEAGGGTVQIPAGTFDTGAIELKTGVNLNLAETDSVLRFSKDIVHENYPLVMTYYEGIACYNWSPLIYAYEQENIAVTGKGHLDGQADENTWWSWYGNVGMGRDFSRLSSSDVTLLRGMNDQGVDVRKRIFGEGHYLRPNFIQMIGCQNILIEDVTIENSPMWGINPVLCSSVTIKGVTVSGQWNNNDGCDPENSRLVLIENCHFKTGGDGISIKSGRGRDGWILREQGQPARDILIRNNKFYSGSSGIAFGSEMSGDIRDVYAEGNWFGIDSLDYGIRLKSNAARGGVVERIYIKDSYMENIRNVALHGTVYYGEGWNGKYLPEFRDITIENMEGSGGEYGIFMEAYPELPIKNLKLTGVHLEHGESGIRAVNWQDPVMEDVLLNGKKYPRPMQVRMSGVPAPGHSIKGMAEIPGGHEDQLSYRWILKFPGEAVEQLVGFLPELEVTEEMKGGMLTLWVEDENGNKEKSMEYRVLSQEMDRKVSSDAVKEMMVRGYLEEPMELDSMITNRDCAKVLYRFWHPENKGETLNVQDLPETDPDYDEIISVLKSGYMSLKSQKGTIKEDVIASNLKGDEVLFFEPDKYVTRGELGQIALLSSGIPYEEMMTVDPDFDDAGAILPQYRSSVGVSAKLGFVKAKEGNYYRPQQLVTWKEFIEMLQTISEYNSR